jgi:hypothetical protein
MRAQLIPALIAVAGLCAGLSVAAAQPKPPERRPGYWQNTMAMGPRTMSTQMCTDAAFEKASSVFGNSFTEKNCAQRDFHPIPGGWAFNSTCTVPNGTDVSSGTVTGDFQTGYHMEMKTHHRRQVAGALPGGACTGRHGHARRPGDKPQQGGPSGAVSGRGMSPSPISGVLNPIRVQAAISFNMNFPGCLCNSAHRSQAQRPHGGLLS